MTTTSRKLSFTIKLLIVLICNILIVNSIYCKPFNPFKPRAKRISSLPPTTSGRKVYGFGSNASGQLGQENYYIPQAIDTFKGKNVSLMCAQQDDSGSNVRVFFVVSDSVGGPSKLYGMGSSTNTLSATVNYLLGLNTTSSYSVPQLIASYSVEIKSLACGTEHVIYVVNNVDRLTVHGFGNNNYEQLGSGFDYLSVPTNISSISSKIFSKVFAFGYSSFGIEDGTNLLYGWGDNSFQKMGISGYIIQPPTLLGSTYYTTVKKVAGYSRSMFVLTTDGKIYAGGSNDGGVLGINSALITQQATPALVSLNGGETVLDVSVYKLGVLASTSVNKLYFWGTNDQSSFCTSTVSSILPVEVSSSLFSTPLTSSISQITTAYQHSVLLTSGGDVYVCGDNSEGQLGLNPWSASVTGAVKSTSTVPSGKTVSAVLAISSKNTFILTSDNAAYSMGKISTNGDQVYYTSPTVMSTISSDVQFDHVYASNGVSFATEYLSGVTWAWGSNRSPYNFLNPDTLIDQQVPRKIPALSSYNITQISIGYGTFSSKLQTSVFFLTNVSTTVFAMGSNSNGQMGLGTGTSTANVTLVPRLIQYENGTILIDSINCGAIHTVMKARRTSATTYSLFVMGGNSRGQSAGVEKEAPIRLSTNTVVMATAGPFHTAFVSYESKGGSGTTRTYYNRAYGTGDSSYGQLGFSALTASSSFREIGNLNGGIDGALSNITSITNIVTSGTSTFIVTSVGVYVVGDNTYGQLGLSPTLNGTKFTTPILNPKIPINAIKIAISQPDGYFSSFLTSDGKLYTFGLNDKGQLGLGHQNNVYTPTQVTIPNSELVIDVALGTEHALIITGTKPCPGDCNYKGTCDSVTGFCTCDESFTGYDCDLYNCVDPKCNGHGSCDTSVGICACDDSYSGVSCERRKCPNDCNGNGLCSSEGVCQCFTGYTEKIDCATPDAGLRSFDAKSMITLILIALSVVLLLTNRN